MNRYCSPEAATRWVSDSAFERWVGWLRKLPAAEFEMLDDRLRDGDAVLVF